MLALNLFLPDSPGWVVVPLSASAATCIGLLYPQVMGEDKDAPDGSKVMRCVAVFVGIYQASIVSFFLRSLVLWVGMTQFHNECLHVNCSNEF